MIDPIAETETPHTIYWKSWISIFGVGLCDLDIPRE